MIFFATFKVIGGRAVNNLISTLSCNFFMVFVQNSLCNLIMMTLKTICDVFVLRTDIYVKLSGCF